MVGCLDFFLKPIRPFFCLSMGQALYIDWNTVSTAVEPKTTNSPVNNKRQSILLPHCLSTVKLPLDTKPHLDLSPDRIVCLAVLFPSNKRKPMFVFYDDSVMG